MEKKRNIVEWAMHYRQIVILIVTCLVAFGVYCLPQMRKNEFPNFTVRQGIVVAVAPGNTSEEMAEQVAKPLENYIFTYKEVKKAKTYSMSRDGIVYIMVELDDDVTDKDAFWSKFKHGVQTFKTSLPQNVMAIVVNDDFGDTSSLLITMESSEKTYRELSDYMDRLQDRLRPIESIGRLTVSGMQQEQISVTLDNDRLSKYGLSDMTVGMKLFQKGFTTTGGRVKDREYTMPIHVEHSINTVYDVANQIVFSSPTGETVRLKDIADIKREYPETESNISNNGKKCLLLSVEMKQGQNVVQMGDDIDAILETFQASLPKDVSIYRITDQSKVVGESVTSFLKELLIAIVAVVIVVMLLLPMRVALVAASTIPISIFISLGLYHAFGIELNTVTLAALIVTLGMIVDNSIVIIDNYLEQIGEGKSRWNASIASTTHFFKSIFSATLAISITFFPFLITCKGMIHDFLLAFPWAVTIVLAVSLAVATLLVPFMQFFFIRKPIGKKERGESKKSFSFLDLMQRYYDALLGLCFRWPKATLTVGVVSIVLGVVLMGKVPQRMLPAADRNQLAVEIYLPTGSSYEKTSAVADSLEHILRKDKRIVSVTSFKGCASPRFHTAYAPQLAGENYAQFIINTTSEQATVEILDDYADRMANHFPEAIVKFKQLSYDLANSPIELRLSGDNIDSLQSDANRIVAFLSKQPELQLVRTNFFEPQVTTTVRLKEEEASRLGVTNAMLESTLAIRYGKGVSVASLWEGDKEVGVVLRSLRSSNATTDNVLDEQIPVMGGLRTVPLRQVAELVPAAHNGQVVRRNGVPTITVMAELKRGYNSMAVTKKLQSLIESEEQKVKNKDLDSSSTTKHVNSSLFPLHSTLTFGGDIEDSNEKMTPVMGGLAIAAVIIFFILLAHFRRIPLALLVFVSMLLSLFGAAVGILAMDVAFGVTCVLGLVSLMGIIVRNGIIMFDYAEELRVQEHMSVRDAIYHSASRRMRPIFLTSAAASMGVIPMILGGSGLWMPMGSVICFGTLISMVFILTVLPIGYLVIFQGTEQRQKARTKTRYFARKKNMKQVLLFFCLSFGLNAFAQNQQSKTTSSLTLDECIAMAINNNQTLQRADRNILMAMEQREQTKTNSLPTISGNVTGFAATKGLVSMNMMGMELSMLDNGVAASVSVMQPVYTGGQITNGNRLAELGISTSRLQRSLTESEVRLTTEKYYWQIVQLEEKLRTLDQLDKQIEQVHRDAQNAVEAGVRNRNDLLQVQLRQNELKATRIQVENGLSVVKDLLAQHMGLNEELEIEKFSTSDSTLHTSNFTLHTSNSTLHTSNFTLPVPPSSLYVCPETALPSTYEYQLLEKQVEAEQLQYKLAEGKNRPTVAVGGMAYYNNFMDSWQARAVGMVTVSVPISNLLYGTKHDMKKQRLKVENAQNQQHDQGEQLVIRMRKAWNDMNDAYRQVEIAQESIKQSEENLRLNTDYYQYGTATISDLLDAQSLYQQAKDQYVETSTNFQIKKREYLQATGR